MACRLAALLAIILALALPAGARDDVPPGRGEGRVLRLVTYNIQWCNVFDLEGQRVANDCTHAVDVLRSLDADFIALQEVRDEAQAAFIADALGLHHHFGYALDGSEGSTLGNAILTRHPILEAQTHLLPRLEWQQRAMVEVLSEVDGQPLRVFSCHLTFNARPDKPLQYMAMLDIIARRAEPRVLMGDFNDMDDRPNEYSPRGFVNLVTGAGHGTILPSVPKMLDVQRLASVPAQRFADPPFHSPRSRWDPPATQANTVSGWEPRVRIDHVFVSPEFHLGLPQCRAWAVDTSAIMARLHPGEETFFVSDHRPLVAELLLPKPPVKLFLNAQEGPTVLAVGESRVLHAGAIDEDGNPVSLLRTDHAAPLGDPAAPGRIIDGTTWSFEGECIELSPVDPLAGHDPYVREGLEYSGRARVRAVAPGEGVLRVSIDGVEEQLRVLVIPAGTPYHFEAEAAP